MTNTKRKNKLNSNTFLDEEEKELIESYENDEWKSDLTNKSKKDFEDAAKFSLKKIKESI